MAYFWLVDERLVLGDRAPVGNAEHGDLLVGIERERVLLERLAHQLHAAFVAAAARDPRIFIAHF